MANLAQYSVSGHPIGNGAFGVTTTHSQPPPAKLQDAQIRAELSQELERLGMPNQSALMLAGWDPYDQNVHAAFFDPGGPFLHNRSHHRFFA